jgi:SAM-dependent methyltransferase
VEEAAKLMREVVENPDEADDRGRRAREDVSRSLAPERTGEFVRERLDLIRNARREDSAHEEAASIPTPLERAERYIREGPAVPLRAPSRLGAAGIFARRLLYRALRPYLARQREFEVAVVDGIRWSTPLELTEAFQAQFQAQVHELGVTLTGQVGRQGEQIDRRLWLLEESLGRLQESLGRLQDAIERHQADVARHFGALDEQSQTLDSQLRALPYVADPALVRTRDEHAREVIGYHGITGNGSARGGVYPGFEDLFRGSEDFIRERQRPYVELIGDRSPVLDAGCGRGEFLDLLEQAGVEAIGVDLDPDMVARSRAKGHQVEEADAIEFLEGRPDDEFGAIFCAQLIEHMPYETLLRFFELAERKLAPGGILIAETVNPHSIAALKTFWVDPTHRSPIFPEVAVALCRLHGYESAVVVFPNGSGELDQDLHREGEYAVVATRSG